MIYTLSLHDALPIRRLWDLRRDLEARFAAGTPTRLVVAGAGPTGCRSEEHTSELQSRVDLVCRLLLEKKNTIRRGRAAARTSRRYRTPLRSDLSTRGP